MNNSTFWADLLEKIAATRPSFETIVVGLLVAVATAVVQWAANGNIVNGTVAWSALAAGVAGAVFNYITSLARVVNPAQSQNLKAKKRY